MPKHSNSGRFEVLLEIGKLVNSTFDLDRILHHAVGKARKQFGYDLVSILIRENGTLAVRACSGLKEKEARKLRVPFGKGIVGKAAKAGKPIISNNILIQQQIFSKYLPAKSMLAVPIKDKKGIIGVIIIEDRGKNAFTHEDMQVISALSDQLAVAIRNAESRKSLDFLNKRLTTLNEAAKVINSSLDLDHILNSILEIIAKQFDYRFSAILLVEGDHLYVKAGRGFRPDVIKKFRPKIGTGTPGTAVSTKRPVMVSDVRKDSRYIDVNTVTKSALAVPIIHEGKAIGAFNIESDKAGNFNEKDMELLSSLAGQAAHAISNAQLYEQVRNLSLHLEKKVEEATKDLVDANMELQRLNQVKSDFISMVSHELRTPLTSIQGYVSLIHDGDTGLINAEQKEFLGIVKSESQRLTRLINDLLDISRIESGKMTFSMEDFDMLDFMGSFEKEIRGMAAAKSMNLKIKSPSSLPRIKADSDKVKQIFNNLVGNAVKFSPINTYLEIEIAEMPQGIRVDVRDQGIGIAKKDLGKIFERFQRVDGSMTRTTGGTGLGLAITKYLIEAHGGSIWVKSRPGKGSTFSFVLPVDGKAR